MVSRWKRASEESRDRGVKGMESAGSGENFGFCTEVQHEQIYLKDHSGCWTSLWEDKDGRTVTS